MKSATAKTVYLGDLRTASVHLKSGNEILTDAPTDNHGKGEAFSPTDLMAAAMTTCMITVMGIAAEKNDWQMGEVIASVKKIMADNPRRIAKLEIEIYFSHHHLSATEKSLLEQIAINCPVAKSMHPDVVNQVKFEYE